MPNPITDGALHDEDQHQDRRSTASHSVCLLCSRGMRSCGLRPLSLARHSVPPGHPQSVCPIRVVGTYVPSFSLYSYVITPHHGMDYVVQDDDQDDVGNGVNNGVHNLSIRCPIMMSIMRSIMMSIMRSIMVSIMRSSETPKEVNKWGGSRHLEYPESREHILWE